MCRLDKTDQVIQVMDQCLQLHNLQVLDCNDWHARLKCGRSWVHRWCNAGTEINYFFPVANWATDF